MVKTYFWNRIPNFGDRLAPLLLKRFTKLDSEWSPAAESDIVMTGSILEHLPKDYRGIIAGIGKLHEETQFDFPNATLLGLRGPLTAPNLKNDALLADPALLADELVPIEDKIYDLGLVPHWTDTELEKRKEFLKYNPQIIRVRENPLLVIREISQCKKIVSSSLHGIILADAFRIPRRIEIAPKMLSKPKQEGGLFKWKDYSASIGLDFEVGVTQEADPYVIEEKQYALFDLFEKIKALLS